MVEIYLNLPSKKSRHTTLFALLGKRQNVKLPTAACHLLPFRSQTSHQLPPLLQSQTPFVSLPFLSVLSLFTTFPDLLSSLEYRAGKVQAC